MFVFIFLYHCVSAKVLTHISDFRVLPRMKEIVRVNQRLAHVSDFRVLPRMKEIVRVNQRLAHVSDFRVQSYYAFLCLTIPRMSDFIHHTYGM